MSHAPRLNSGKHCFVPCPPERCDCGRGRRPGKGRLTLNELARLEGMWREEHRLKEIERLRAEGKTDEALVLALNL